MLQPEERQVIRRIAAGQPPHSQRARALLALNSGASQASAAEVAGLTEGQVKYWLRKFRKVRLSIFPQEAQPVQPAQPDDPGEAPPGEAPAETAEIMGEGGIKETNAGGVKMTTELEQPDGSPHEEQKPLKKKSDKKADKKAKGRPADKAKGMKGKGKKKDKKRDKKKDKKSKVLNKDKKKKESEGTKNGKRKKGKKVRGDKSKKDKKRKDKKKKK